MHLYYAPFNYFSLIYYFTSTADGLHDEDKKGRRELTYVIQGWWKLDYRLYGDVVDSLRSSATGTGEIRL